MEEKGGCSAGGAVYVREGHDVAVFCRFCCVPVTLFVSPPQELACGSVPAPPMVARDKSRGKMLESALD